ncbi:hypothetical protein FS749_004658 [Ceratobasidium sp. UAMH 11750]|nr:hypothetical protein FS749_004658 [Ceratobasidium sp. UAMH 11750]
MIKRIPNRAQLLNAMSDLPASPSPSSPLQHSSSPSIGSPLPPTHQSSSPSLGSPLPSSHNAHLPDTLNHGVVPHEAEAGAPHCAVSDKEPEQGGDNIIQIDSDDSGLEDTTTLICALCRSQSPVSHWLLRCGHIIDDKCYRKLAEGPTDNIPNPQFVIQWNCPVAGCHKDHWSEVFRVRGRLRWYPLKGMGAILYIP